MKNFISRIYSLQKQVMPTKRALYWALVTLGFIAFTAILGVVFHQFRLPWQLYAAIVGVQFAIACGVVVLVNIHPKAQIAAVGAISGMGLDQMIGSANESESLTAIDTLAKIVVNTVSSITNATGETGLPAPQRLTLSVGLWSFFIALALIMLFGSLEPSSD